MKTSQPSLRLLILALTYPVLVAWLNPTRDKVEAGVQRYKQGKYEEAIGTFGELLVDDPDSSLLNYNMGVASYKAGKYTEAIASFGRVKTREEDPKHAAKIAYNAGNAQYQLGAAAEAEKPQDALNAYTAALVAYRRALGIDPSDIDAKFNYELVAKKMADLKKRLEEQPQQQDQQQQDQQPQKEQQEEQQQEEPSDSQEQPQQETEDQEPQEPEEQDSEQHQPPSQGKEEQQEPSQNAPSDNNAGESEQGSEDQVSEGEKPPPQEGAGNSAAPSGEKKEKMSAQEAASLLDAAKNEEIRPEDFARQRKGGGVADAAEDW